MTIEDKIKGIEKGCLEGIISPINAALMIDETIGGVTRVEYRDGLKFKVDNHTCRVGLTTNGLQRKYLERARELAVALYFKAKANGEMFPGEVHIGAGASTKHYMEGIRRIYQGLCYS